MARIAGVNIPVNKRIEVGLTYVHGIGASTASKIVKDVGVDANTYVKDLTEDEIVKLREAVEASRGRGRPAARALPEHQAPLGDRRLAASATAADCRSGDSARRPTPAAARARGG